MKTFATIALFGAAAAVRLSQPAEEECKFEKAGRKVLEAIGDRDLDEVATWVDGLGETVADGVISLDEAKEGLAAAGVEGISDEDIVELGGLIDGELGDGDGKVQAWELADALRELKKWGEGECTSSCSDVSDLASDWTSDEDEGECKFERAGRKVLEVIGDQDLDEVAAWVDGLGETAPDGVISLDEAKEGLAAAGVEGLSDGDIEEIGGLIDGELGDGDGKVQAWELADGLRELKKWGEGETAAPEETTAAQEGEDDVLGRLKKAGRKVQKALEGVSEEDLKAGLEEVAGDDGVISLDEASGALKKAGVELKDSDLELVGGLVDEHLGDGDGKVQVDEAVKALKKLRELDLDEEEGECRLKAAGKKVQKALEGVSREDIEAGLKEVAGDDGEISLTEAKGALKLAGVELSDEEVAIVGGLIDGELGDGDGKVQVGEAADALVWLQDADLDALQ